MLSKEERNRRIDFDEHTIVRIYERGIKEGLFPHCDETKEIWCECLEFLKEKTRSIVVQDTRRDKEGSHICMFINNHGNLVAMPIAVHPDKIWIFSIFDPKKNTEDPNWFINRYNSYAPEKGLAKHNLIIK